MSELFIERHGEVRLGSDVVGAIQWAGPCAFYGVTGEWEQNAGYCCYECGGHLASAEAFEEVEKDRDELEGNLEKANKEIEKLTREIQALRGPEANSDG